MWTIIAELYSHNLNPAGQSQSVGRSGFHDRRVSDRRAPTSVTLSLQRRMAAAARPIPVKRSNTAHMPMARRRTARASAQSATTGASHDAPRAIVCGAGPIGAVTAALLAQRGFRVLCLERREDPATTKVRVMDWRSNGGALQKQQNDKHTESIFGARRTSDEYTVGGGADTRLYRSYLRSRFLARTRWQLMRAASKFWRR